MSGKGQKYFWMGTIKVRDDLFAITKLILTFQYGRIIAI